MNYYYPQFYDPTSDYHLLRQMQHGTIPQHGGVQGSPQLQHGGGPQHGYPPPPPPPPQHGGGGHGYPPHDGGQQHHDGPPQGPPPSYIPQETASLYAVEAGGLRPCLYRYTYIWLRNGRSFWFYPTYVGRTSTAGYRWRGWHWEYYGTDLNRIRSFSCH